MQSLIHCNSPAQGVQPLLECLQQQGAHLPRQVTPTTTFEHPCLLVLYHMELNLPPSPQFISTGETK